MQEKTTKKADKQSEKEFSFVRLTKLKFYAKLNQKLFSNAQAEYNKHAEVTRTHTHAHLKNDIKL